MHRCTTKGVGSLFQIEDEAVVRVTSSHAALFEQWQTLCRSSIQQLTRKREIVGATPARQEVVKTPVEPACPYCSGRSSHVVSSTDRNRRTTKAKFDYYACSECGLIFMHSPPKDMSPFYTGGYDPIPATVSELQQIAADEKFRSEPILKHKKSGRYLEIGPWRGVLCSAMKDAGFDVTAIEMNELCVSFLREHLGVEAIQSTNPAETMKNLKPGFDVIAAWHSLEHLPDPWLVIEHAAQLLAPGGILVLGMPNPESYEFSVLKSAWMHLDAPRHLYFFPIKSLIHFCEKNGLNPLEITTADHFSNVQSRFAWQAWPRSWVPIRYVRYAFAITIGNLLYKLAYKKQMTEGLGSAYTAVFIRS